MLCHHGCELQWALFLEPSPVFGFNNGPPELCFLLQACAGRK